MSGQKHQDLDNFQFRDLHPKVRLGTASDRYAGWIGQVYSRDWYRVTKRQKRISGRVFTEEVLPVESVEEYFQHFPVLELDFTFYQPLLGKDGSPTRNFHVLRAYRRHLKPGDLIILKVPQAVFAARLKQKKGFIENPKFLDPEFFMVRFYEPIVNLLDPWLEGLIFEQEYQRKAERPSPEELAFRLDRFFSSIQKDDRYHVELRTEALLAGPVLEVFEEYGIGQVLSHWTWLPRISKQFVRAGKRFLNASNHGVIRLMTPRGIKYEEAYAKAHPFDALVEGMMNHEMIADTAAVLQSAAQRENPVNVIINNRAGGNAPLIARHLAGRFLADLSRVERQKTRHQ